MAAADDDRRALGALIEAKAERIAQLWLERVQTQIVAQHGDVQVTLLRDGMPDYLAALARLALSAPDVTAGAARWAQVAREHGITRVRVGFNIEQLVREFVTLRNVIEDVALGAGTVGPRTVAWLADMIDAAIGKSVQAYVETRDYEARRRQAEGIGFLIHELRNPLSAATSAAELVREHAVPGQAKALDMLVRAHDRLNELIDGVLLTEQLEAGRGQPSFAEVNVRELVDKASAAARQVAAKKQLDFTIDCSREYSARIDPDLTRSALQNLVDNAVKYTDDGSVEVVVEDRATSWSVHVRDTCPGLSQAELRTVFEPFQRGTTSRAKQGTGLGLAIARRAIEAQGGKLQAESPGPVGCHFWFTLPKRS